jgi:DNA-directed RNA polymerase subunit N (RpoN/RPB10)
VAKTQQSIHPSSFHPSIGPSPSTDHHQPVAYPSSILIHPSSSRHHHPSIIIIPSVTILPAFHPPLHACRQANRHTCIQTFFSSIHAYKHVYLFIHKWHYITLHSITFPSLPLHHIHFIPVRCLSTLHYITLQYKHYNILLDYFYITSWQTYVCKYIYVHYMHTSIHTYRYFNAYINMNIHTDRQSFVSVYMHTYIIHTQESGITLYTHLTIRSSFSVSIGCYSCTRICSHSLAQYILKDMCGIF